MLARLHLRLQDDGLIDLDTWLIDTITVRASRAAAGAQKNRRADSVRAGSKSRRAEHPDSSADRLPRLATDLDALARPESGCVLFA